MPWPDDLLLPRAISVSGSDPLSSADPQTIRQYELGRAQMVAAGVWCDDVDASGVRSLRLYPAQASTVPVELEYVYRPVPLAASTDEPSWMPAPYHKGLLYSAAAVYFEDVEDNPELAKWNQEKADSIASEVRAYDIERRSGSGVFQIPVVGWTAPSR